MFRRKHDADPRDRRLRHGEEPPLAAHLVTPRVWYSHHGIYVGGGLVIHYAGLAHGWRGGPVEIVPLERFARGRGIRVRKSSPFFSRSEVVARARSRLGEHRYRILSNNCEHFCAWALRGEARSGQVEQLRALPRVVSRRIGGWWRSGFVGPAIAADGHFAQTE